MSYLGNSPSTVPLVEYKFTATQGQTVFSGFDDDGKTLSYTYGNLDVIVNGLVLTRSDFIQSAGTITLNVARDLNDTVVIKAYGEWSSANHYTKAENDAFLATKADASDALTALDIVGTVSQSGGVPTGAIIESGSNANGDYIRFANGTQICKYLGALNTTAPSVWSGATLAFPAAFSAAPHVISGLGAPVSNQHIITAANPTSGTTMKIYLLSSSAVSNQQFFVVAIGEWF